MTPWQFLIPATAQQIADIRSKLGVATAIPPEVLRASEPKQPHATHTALPQSVIESHIRQMVGL